MMHANPMKSPIHSRTVLLLLYIVPIFTIQSLEIEITLLRGP